MLPVFRYASHQTSDYTYYPVLSCIDRDDAGRSAKPRNSHDDAKDNPDSGKLKIITLHGKNGFAKIIKNLDRYRK